MEDRFNINPDDPTPIYAQLERAIRFAIATDRLRIGEQLPTVRQLAVDLKINANTVAKVYAELERVGVLETRRGIGTFVSARQPASAMRAMRGARERELRALADRILAEAYSLGFSLEEVIEQLESSLSNKSAAAKRR
ncbi:MAG TPA: GntR family transcriptional regulator [Blastocatellia bacterium]|nr:GntR family transcriptional regulator [Blastocatellia bacterium]HMV83265.1 GntR family transcriptional regulator [Blastocatellia bacterium]HMX25223.1 GntR family transcriptional regulator [Blastocatellia bacterium]HMY72748.1 GntR family transcriptional regulator [Blastocatellia bacterium]HMZ16759.1 GntR family transcriptional regulator [Blastocatellia bacterium]